RTGVTCYPPRRAGPSRIAGGLRRRAPHGAPRDGRGLGVPHARARPRPAPPMGGRGTVAVSESSTGGLISAALLSIPGASAYFVGGGVIYTQTARRDLLQLPDEAGRGIRSSTEAAARLNEKTIRERLGTTWALAATGAAGGAAHHHAGAARGRSS